MAADKPQKNHEEMRVKVEQAKREVLPAVELETKEIKMVVLPPTSPEVPSIVMTFDKDADSKSNGADKIVGISVGPQGGDEQTSTDTNKPPDQTRLQDTEGKAEETITKPPSPKLGTRLTVETEHLMEFFEDKKKTQGLSPKRSSSKKRRTPSPSPIRQSIGLDHLDNLVRLMEQLGSLRDENSRLKHRCDYLESTKTLLIAKSSLDDDDTLLNYHSNSLPRSKKGGKSHSTKSSKSDSAVRLSRPRLPSAEDAHLTEIDFTEGNKRLNGKPLYKRSFSTGSLEVPSDIMEQSGEDELGSHRLLDDPFLTQDSSKLSKSPESKRKSKFSKWAKVKKVLNKQQVQEHISSGIKSIKGFGKGAYLRYAPVTGRELMVPPPPSVAESRSVDSGVGSGMDGEMDVRKSTSSNEPPSPTRFIERHIDVPTPVIDDCMGIWLGPPEWIEKEREKEQQLLKMSTGLSESPKSEPGDLGSPQSISGYDEDGEQFLQVPLIRRQSSPLLLEGQEEEVYEDSHLKRTSSYKEGDGSKDADESFHKIEKGEKKHRTPWGKMKNIIHTRKDSVKKKPGKGGREGDTFTFEEVSETDFDMYDEMKYLHEGYFEGPVGRSTPKASPVIFRQKQRDKSSSISPPAKGQEASKTKMSGGSLNVSTLLGGVTDEFTRKLQEWEELKGKRMSGQFKESPDYSEGVSNESAGAVSPEFLKKMEEWERVKSLKGTSVSEKKHEAAEIQIDPETDTSSDEIEEICTMPDRSRQSVNVEEIQRKLTDSFSRKMEEWERQKYQRHASTDGREPSQKSSFKERPKSKKTKEEKEREKYEKMREREILRVEREEQKLEKEKMRIEKERLKALEREAKIEKMKGRLSQPDMDASLKNPVLSPLTDYKVTAEFARKLHEWELRKGKEMSTAMYLEAQKRSLQFSMEYQNATSILSKNGNGAQAAEETEMRKTSSESDDLFLMEEAGKQPETKQKGEKPPPLTLVPCFESPDMSPKFPVSDDSSIDDHTSETHESMTQANIASLEKANSRLLEELRNRELEYNSLQIEVKDLNERLVNFRNEHALELDLYRAQLMEQGTSVDVTLDTQHMSHTLLHLEDKIADLKKFGEQLAMSMEGAAVGKFQTVEGEESINTRLVDLLDKMRLLLQQATITGENTLEEVSKKSSALHNFEKLYSQAMHLQVQMNNLRLSQLERNKEIMNMKRHLLLQEANNLLLQADVTRREAELLYYKEYSQKRAPIKRWNTYSGKEDRARMPGQESPQKQSIFQRVQRLRSTRPLISSTTDSDSDAPAPPVRRESPRVRKRESPKLRKKDSPTTRKRESPNVRRKQESPRLRRKESPKLSIHHPILEERSTERLEEHVKPISSLQADTVDGKHVKFSTVTLPTAKVTLPKDISPQEINGVPRSVRDKGGTPEKSKSQQKQEIKPVVEEVVEESKTDQVQASKGASAKFPELLIPEWRKQSEPQKKSHSHRMPHFDPDDVFDLDNDVFIDKIEEKQVTLDDVKKPARVKLQECAKLGLDKSFDSSETSEDTLKYLSPEPSPAPKVEPPKFPASVQVVRKPATETCSETASDPGRSRPTSLIKVTVHTPVLLRKPPSGQQIRGQSSRLNIPVIPLKIIKPAQELLDDSQKYRSGHSIYLTRILKRYPMKIECRSRSLDERKRADKENIRAGYVQTIVQQLSREGTPGTPDSGTSPKLTHRGAPSTSLARTDSPKSEFVQQIVRKLSSPSGPTESEKSGSPLKDLTNDGQVRTLKKAFTNGERQYVSVTVKGSQECVSLSSSATSSTLTFSQLSTKTEPGQGPDSTISSTKVTYSSMPMLSLEGEDSVRERSATTSNGSNGSPTIQSRSYSLTKDSPTQRHRIHVAVSMSPGRSRRIIDPSLSPARLRRLMDPASPSRRRRMHDPSPIEQVEEEPLEASVSVAQSETLPSIIDIKSVPRRSPKTKRKDKSTKMGTIEALCRQSMTFDLGVSLQGAEGLEGEDSDVKTEAMRHSTSSATSTSSQSETEGAAGTSEKKKSRHKFMDSSFIQKSRKFFKVSNYS